MNPIRHSCLYLIRRGGWQGQREYACMATLRRDDVLPHDGPDALPFGCRVPCIDYVPRAPAEKDVS